MKNFDKILTHFGDALCIKKKKKQKGSHVVFKLTMESPPCAHSTSIKMTTPMKYLYLAYLSYCLDQYHSKPFGHHDDFT